MDGETRNRRREEAAAMGCGICGAPIVDPAQGGDALYAKPPSFRMEDRWWPRGDSFSEGPYAGRYWCVGCWVLYYADHPEHLADAETERHIELRAADILRERNLELLYEEGENKVYLTYRGTILFRLVPREGYGVGEFHPDDYQMMLRAFQEIDRRGIQGFTREVTQLP